MGTADIVTKMYMRENTVFADAFNYLIYDGKKVIDPAKLTEVDTTEIAIPFGLEAKFGEEKENVKWEEWKLEKSPVKNEPVRNTTPEEQSAVMKVPEEESARSGIDEEKRAGNKAAGTKNTGQKANNKIAGTKNTGQETNNRIAGTKNIGWEADDKMYRKTDAVQKYRDLLKAAVIKQDEKMSYVLLGIENQTDIHYAMPVRNAIYDALQYGRQVSEIAAGHRRNQKDFTGKTRGEYLSGFLKEDCIKPVITLVIHFGAEEWDGPLSLHEMMSIKDIEILSFVENYRIHLIDPAKLTEEQLNKFSTSMREVMGYIKYSKNKEKLLEFLRTDTHKSIEMNAARVIKIITNTPIEVSEEKEKIEMCKAIEDLIAESEARGEIRGEARGEARGRAEGIIEMCIEMNIPKENIIKRLQDKLDISLRQADEYFEIYEIRKNS